jgi:L-ascorbate oxidase
MPVTMFTYGKQDYFLCSRRVWNQASDQNITMHWHGLSQFGSPFSDGTPSASQWPIPAGKYFDYEFLIAKDVSGTLYFLKLLR